MFGLTGDNLAIALFFWSLAAFLLNEGRKEQEWQRWILWGLCAIALVMGFGWRYLEPLWPAGYAFIQAIAVSPVSWFVLFMAVVVSIIISGRIKQSQALPEAAPSLQQDALEGLKQYMEARFTGITNGMEAIWAKINEMAKVPPPPPAQTINWKPWKLMPDYTVRQLAKILSRIDPGDTKMTTEANGYRDLIMKAMEAGDLPYIKEYTLNEWNGTKHETKRDYDTRIKQSDALFWGRHNRFDVSHIERSLAD